LKIDIMSNWKIYGKKYEGEVETYVEEETSRKTGRETMGEGSAGGGFLNFVKLKAGFFFNLSNGHFLP